MKTYLNKFSKKILDFIYPPVCGICGKLCNDDICRKCQILLLSKIEAGIDDYSLDDTKYFEEHIYIFNYNGIIREKILQYKFQEKTYLYKIFLKIILNNKKIYNKFKNYDIIIPVPLHKKRKIERGYNQCEIIAKNISKKSNLFLNTISLQKEINTVAQSTLNRDQRHENIKNAYICRNKELIKNKKILIFDDVYTTGNTVNECSKELKCAGAGKIGILTIAKV